MSEFRKIYYPKCPYCKYQYEPDLEDYYLPDIVGLCTGAGPDDVIIECANCSERYRVTVSIKFNSRRVPAEEQ